MSCFRSRTLEVRTSSLWCLLGYSDQGYNVPWYESNPSSSPALQED